MQKNTRLTRIGTDEFETTNKHECTRIGCDGRWRWGLRRKHGENGESEARRIDKKRWRLGFWDIGVACFSAHCAIAHFKNTDGHGFTRMSLKPRINTNVRELVVMGAGAGACGANTEKTETRRHGELIKSAGAWGSGISEQRALARIVQQHISKTRMDTDLHG